MHIPGYQIERELGQGGMAIVYLALQESLHRHVALKVIKPLLTTDEEFAQRFLREGRIIAQLSDPHIVTVYDIATHDNTYYLSMEYLPGGTLQQRIREGLPLEDALAIARAIASALHYAHRRNIIHRDIKPQNILFRENGQPVLTDFGIAKTLGSTTVMTRTGLSIGTPRYMSPEQIRGQTVDARADLYSFGVLFHEMLTGNVPFTADDSFALAMMHVTAPVPELPPGLSRFQPLLNRLLDKDPGQRFQSGQEFITALDTLEKAPTDLFAATGPIRQVPMPAAPPSRRFGWKTGALAALLAGAAIAGGYWFVHRPAPLPQVTTPSRPPEPPVTDLAAQRRAEADQMLAQARQQQQAGALEDSLARIDQGLKLVPDHPALLALRQEIDRQIAEASDRKAREEQQIQAQLQAEQFLDQAQRARQEGKLDLSLVHIEQGLQAVPNHPVLLALKQEVLAQQAQLKRQEDAARRQAEAAERQRLEAERQKADAEQHRRKADELLARALDSQRNRAYETSLLQIEQGLQQVPDHSRLLALRDEVRRQLREVKAPPPEPADETAKITALLRECQGHLKANRLTSGKGGNAADCYAEVLKRDRGNAQALAGLDQIADRYADQGAAALQRGDAKAAKGAVDRLERLNAAHPRLADLRDRLARVETAAKPVSPPPTEPPEEPVAPVRPITPPPVAVPGPAPQPGAPPIELVSIPQPAEQPPIKPEPPAPAARPVTAEQAWAAVKDSSDRADIEQFLATYPKSRQATEARARLKAMMKQEQPSGSAQLLVRADVEDAEISINGKTVGTVPMQIEMKPGAYRVRVSKQGYTDWSGKVDLAAGDESKLEVMLAKKLTVATAPPAAPRETPEPPPEPLPAAGGVEKPAAGGVEKPGAAPQPAPAPRPPETQAATASRQAPNCLRGNCENGEGTYRYPDGSEYTGEFRNAKMHGQGTYVYAGRGEKYVGEWRNGVINGQGAYYYRSGNRYVGDWRNGRKSGQGTYFYANRGDKYVGEFANDEPNGQGTYYYSNGDRYEGEWRNGLKNGHGVMYENGKKIVGEWQNDQKVRVTVE